MGAPLGSKPKVRIPPAPPEPPPPPQEPVTEKDIEKPGTPSEKKKRLARGRRGLRIDLSGPGTGGAKSSGLNIPT